MCFLSVKDFIIVSVYHESHNWIAIIGQFENRGWVISELKRESEIYKFFI
jgi:hypothetical protein